MNGNILNRLYGLNNPTSDIILVTRGQDKMGYTNGKEAPVLGRI